MKSSRKDVKRRPARGSKTVMAPRRSSAGSGRPASLARQAYETIREKILRGEFFLDAVLSRRQIARQLRMSLPPVYEAVQRLEGDGLLESKSRVGTRLRLPTRQDVLERSIVREALESQSARLFTERASIRERSVLIRLAARLDKLYNAWESGRSDPDFIYRLNTLHLQLHVHIADGSRCPALREAIEREQALIFNWFYGMAARRRVPGRGFHSRLAAALVGGDPIEADAAMRGHIRFGVGEILEKIGAIKNQSGWRMRRLS